MKILPAFLILILCSGCELVRIGQPRREYIVPSQETAVGAVYLFKAELDSNNATAAVQMMARPNGSRLLAAERYELRDEMERLGRIIGNKSITGIRSDTLDIYSQRVKLEFDYIKKLIFTTRKIDREWYIVDISE
jgi:hypothetical protein